MLLTKLRSFLMVGFICSIMTAQAADAGTSLDVNAGLGIASGSANQGISSISPGFGAEFGFGLTGEIEVGAFFTYNILMDSTSTDVFGGTSTEGGNNIFYGGKFRYYFSGTLGVFGDVLLGLTQASQHGQDGSAAFGFGLRIGSKIPMGGNSIIPYAGFRSLPYKPSVGNFSRTMFDIGLMFSFDLYGG